MVSHTYEETRSSWKGLSQDERRELIEERVTIRCFCILPTGTIIDIATDEIYARDQFSDLHEENDVEFTAFRVDGVWEGCSQLLSDTLDDAFESVWREIDILTWDDLDDARLSVTERVGSELRGFIHG
jgi:hypothetical protein